ncbi:hypothetical protein D3C71_662000 [compost metagenome]
MIEQAAHRLEKTADVQARDAFMVFAQLRQRRHFKQLFKGSQATGQGNERVRAIAHAGLAAAHVGCHFMPGQAWVQMPEVAQQAGDDANHFTALGEHGVGHHAHQAFVCTAIHQTQTTPGDFPAQRPGAFDIGRVEAVVGAGKHGNAAQGRSGSHGIIPGVRFRQALLQGWKNTGQFPARLLPG